MSLWTAFLAPRKRLLQQEQEIRRLRRELAALQASNDSMRQGMRRCLGCDYRSEYRRRQAGAAGADITPQTN